LPEAIVSNGRSVLDGSVDFTLVPNSSHSSNGFIAPFTAGVVSEIELGPGGASASWTRHTTTLNGTVEMVVDGTMGYDGHIDYAMTVTSHVTFRASNMVLQVPVAKALALFANGAGMGSDGGFFPATNTSKLNWRWEQPPHRPGVPVPTGGPTGGNGWRVWLGDVDAGLFLKLKGAGLGWNRAQGDPAIPASWSNGGRGGIQVTAEALIKASTGSQTITQGETMLFNFSLLATPVKGDYTSSPAGKAEHYTASRHYHVPYGHWVPPTIESLKTLGASVCILHQGNDLNPYINYPFHPAVTPKLKSYTDQSMAAGIKVKVYYTVGQLSNHAVELFALAGLNGEILLRNASDPIPEPHSHGTARLGGMGGNLIGNAWLEEHMVTGFEGGWFTLNPGGEEDASIADNTTSRWLNFYIQGQAWLFSDIGLSGLYYDGFQAERSVQQRIRRMAESEGHNAWYDVHGRAFDNTELLPFVDSMWTAEGIDFTQGPDYWLISIAALPFGTFGEMLGADSTPPVPGTFCGESCANKWRGMLFGMTNRAGWNGVDPNDNRHLWKLWDGFGIQSATMMGWWNKSAPVCTGNKGVFATTYVQKGHASLVAIASWATTNQTISLQLDWSALGLKSATSEVVAPAGIPSFNHYANETQFPITPLTGAVTILVPAYKGWLLLVQPKAGGKVSFTKPATR
jgi:hypothetical protein